jgi:hypothetical protein
MRVAFDAAAAGGGKGKAVEQASSSSGQFGISLLERTERQSWGVKADI